MKQKKIKWINSIQARLILTLLTTILFILCFSLGLNIVFSQTFYENSRISKLIDLYEMVRYEEPNNLDKLSCDNNVTIYKLNVSEDNTTLSMNYPNDLSPIEFENLEDTIKEYYINGKTDLVSVITKTDTYIICKMLDPILESNYLDLFARYEDKIIYIRLNLENIADIVETTNTLLIYISFLAIFEGCILMIIVSNRFTKPILSLSKIANNMASLKFDEKYLETREDEIGVLGTSINFLSQNLQDTIQNLEKANHQLEQDLKEKEKIDEMRKSFISDVSHELKTPIALIQGYAEGLKYGIEDNESREFYCDTIIDESEKMSQMVKKLTSLSQIEYGYAKSNPIILDIKDVIENKLQTMKFLFEEHFVKTEYELFHQNVYVDEFLLDEILNNYLSNAIHHIDGEHNLKIWMENKKNYIKISFFNNGNNIPEEELEKIWIKFYKVDKARTREYGGSGIGLSIVKAIMESIKQNCGCYNREDGVVFWFTLPKPINNI